LTVDPSLSIPGVLSSDSHFPEDIGSAYTVTCWPSPSLRELRLALRDGREGGSCRGWIGSHGAVKLVDRVRDENPPEISFTDANHGHLFVTP